MPIPERFIDELKSRLNVSDVVGKRVRLERKGRELQACCPFHKEKTPSFTVNDAKGFYHCFGCGQHGNIISFMMEYEGLNFPEAVERLAAEAGMEVPVERPEERQKRERSKTLKEVVALAAQLYREQLYTPAGKKALAYIEGRGLTDAAIEKFGLGYAPNSRDWLIKAMAAKGVSIEPLLETALAKKPDDGRPAFDMFRDRLMFPICDGQGNPVAFGGRILGDGEPKYLNSPETSLFHKGRLLYGAHLARKSAYDHGEVIVAEGYMDVIALAEGGFTQSVAPLGTAVTEDHLAQLFKFASEPILCFDGDNAGQRAMARAAERALPGLKPGNALRFAILPKGDDPDTLIRNRGATAMRAILNRSATLVDVLWRSARTSMRSDGPEQRAGLWHELRNKLAVVEDPLVKGNLEAAFQEKFEGDFGHSPFGKRRGTKSQYGVKAPGPGFGRKSGKGGLGASALSNLRNAAGTLNRRVTDGVLSCLLNHPVLIDDYGEVVAQLELMDHEQQHALRLMMQWCVEVGDSVAVQMDADGHPALDTTALTDHLERHGYRDVAHRLTSDETYVHAGFAKPTTRLETVIQGLEHLLGRLHEPVLRSERIAATSKAISQPSNASLREWKLRAAADMKREGRSIDLDAYDHQAMTQALSGIKADDGSGD